MTAGQRTEIDPRVTDLLRHPTPTWAEHVDRVGPLPQRGARALLAEIADSGLTGRGGGHFPTARKLALIAGSRDAVVIGNGAEGEPASSKDRVLLHHSPHLVLDGLTLAARIAGTRTRHLAAPADLIDDVVAPALRGRPEGRVRLHAVPDGFVTGQETSVAAAVEGRPVLPVTLTGPLMTHGISGRPTIVLNVETLAHLALIARFGATWFRSRGVPDDPGTRLVTISGAVQLPGVWEARGGTTLGEIIDVAGGATEPLQALLVGGYHGCWVPWTPQAAASPLTRAGLQEYQASPGAGVLIALPARRCGLQAAAGVAAYLAGESAGQCGPCLNGLPAIAGHLNALAYGHREGHNTDSTVGELYRLADTVDGRGACRHPDGTARFIRSTLQVFATEVSHHRAGRCTAPDDQRAVRPNSRNLPWQQS